MIWIIVATVWLALLVFVMSLCVAAARGDEQLARASFGTRIGTKAPDQADVRAREQIGGAA